MEATRKIRKVDIFDNIQSVLFKGDFAICPICLSPDSRGQSKAGSEFIRRRRASDSVGGDLVTGLKSIYDADHPHALIIYCESSFYNPNLETL